MNFKNIATITGLATSAAVAFTAVPAQAVSFTVESNTCISSSCVELGEIYDVTGGAVLDPAADKKNTYLTPGSNDSTAFDPDDDSDSVKSYSLTSLLDDPIGAVDAIIVDNLKGTFEFFWGSVDTYNLIEFFDGDTLTGSFTGTDIAIDQGLGGTENKAGNYNFDAYVSFEGFFDSAKLSILPDEGSGIAFEVATAAKVPEPASILGLAVVGLLGGGSLLKRREQSA
jgi:hypothetical protein